jgi:predicted flap endonuclease-1-like 5' DNA nuclease
VDLESSRGEAADAAGRSAELETAKAAAEEAAAEAASDRAGTVQKLEQDLAAEREDAAALQQRVADLESALAECGERRDELESRVAELVAVPVVEEVAGASEGTIETPVQSDEEQPSQEEGLARIAEIAARTAGGMPAADDDLKKVHGIGPKLERTLKDLGITSFRQIAKFEAEDIAYVTAALDAFKGRIERDDWMGSAAVEHERKYGEPV